MSSIKRSIYPLKLSRHNLFMMTMWYSQKFQNKQEISPWVEMVLSSGQVTIQVHEMGNRLHIKCVYCLLSWINDYCKTGAFWWLLLGLADLTIYIVKTIWKCLSYIFFYILSVAMSKKTWPNYVTIFILSFGRRFRFWSLQVIFILH